MEKIYKYGHFQRQKQVIWREDSYQRYAYQIVNHGMQKDSQEDREY